MLLYRFRNVYVLFVCPFTAFTFFTDLKMGRSLNILQMFLNDDLYPSLDAT